jgi:hypothetical protein
MRIPDYPADTRQGSNLLRRSLGVASGHDDLAIWIAAMDAAYGRSCVLIGRGGHGTGVQNHDLGLLGRGGPAQTALLELLFQGSPVGLSGSAAKILHIKARHSNIVT